MARTLTNISEFDSVLPEEKVQVLSFSEELVKIEKIKFGLCFGYFVGLVILSSTLFL